MLAICNAVSLFKPCELYCITSTFFSPRQNSILANRLLIYQQDQFQRPYSDETAAMIDSEVRKLVLGEFERSKQLLRDKRHELDVLAQHLLEREVLLK